ncbi:extracellular solute-binding protein [Rhizobium leguminosarum bv. viciae]|nr:extracellular solute-binding protein [Rhizobium leguminosarum bv. viciae]
MTDYKATNTPCGKDLLTPLVEAFRAEGLKIGFYYSLLDWHHPDFPIDVHHPLRNHPDAKALNAGRNIANYAAYMREQVRELLTGFGRIDIIWFDFSYPGRDYRGLPGKGRADWESERLVDLVRELQPEIIVNNRLDLPPGNLPDVTTPEQYTPRVAPAIASQGVLWETCHTFSGLAAAWGDRYVNDAGELDLTSASAVAAADRLIGFAAKDKIAPLVPSGGADPGDVVQGRFNSGNVAMYIDGPWSIIGMKDQAKFKIGLTTLPRDEGELSAVTAGSGFGISTTSKNKDAAWKAIQVLTSSEALSYLAEQGRALPARTASQSAWYKVAAKDITNGGEAIDYSLAHSVPYVITNNWAAVENLFNQYFPPAFAGSADVKQTMESIQSLAQQ